MIRTIRRILATSVVAAALAAISVFSGFVSPASAASEYWVVQHSDHVDLVVDWFAVTQAATSLEENYEECRAVSDAAVGFWRVEPETCAGFVLQCASMAEADPRYRDHAIRVSFYFDKQECAVIGVT